MSVKDYSVHPYNLGLDADGKGVQKSQSQSACLQTLQSILYQVHPVLFYIRTYNEKKNKKT